MPATEDRRHVRGIRGVATATALALAVGFAWGAVTIARQYRRFLEERMPTGPSATVDWFLQSAGMGTSEELLNGVALAGLPADVDVAFVAPVSKISRQDFWQTCYVSSYLLYPRRVWGVAWCDPPAETGICETFPAASDLVAAVSAHGARHVLLVGDVTLPLTHVRTHRLSSSLTLLDLR